MCDLRDGAIEGLLIGAGGVGGAGDLADVLQCGGVHLILRGGGFEVVECVDVPAHALHRTLSVGLGPGPTLGSMPNDPSAADDAIAEIVEAADRVIDEITGFPKDEGEVEEFSYAGATVIAERRGDEASRTTFVLVHGIGMGRKVFGDLVLRLRDHGVVIAIDQPGYGTAPEPPRTLSMERTADLVAAYLRHLGRGPVVLLGHSMGTQVVTEVAVRHPDAVDSLVLVAPTVDRRHRHALSQLGRLALDLVGESPKVLLVGAREYLRAGPNLRRKMHAMLVHRPELSYPRITAPTLVIRGERDRVSPASWCAEVAGAIPHARDAEVLGHGHETLIRDAEPAAREILDFVSARPGRP